MFHIQSTKNVHFLYVKYINLQNFLASVCMTRKRPEFVKESSEDEYDENFEDYIDNNLQNIKNFDEKEIQLPKRGRTTKKSKAKESKFEGDIEFEGLFDFDGEDLDFCSSEPNKPEDLNNIYELNKYWPHLLNSDQPEDRNLLYLFSKDFQKILACPSCRHDGKSYVELVSMYRYSCEDVIEYVKLDKHPKSLPKFMSNFEPKFGNITSVEVVAIPNCCDQVNQVKEWKVERNIFNFKLLRTFYFNSKLHVYLDISESTIDMIPKSLKFELSKHLKSRIFSEKLIHTEIGDSNSNSAIFSDTFDFPEAELPAGFNLNLREYQLRSISWMKELESSKPTESNSIINNFYQGEEGCFLKVKLGSSPYYVGIGGTGNITTSPLTCKRPEPLRLYGGILADDTGSGKTVTMLGLIHSSPFTKEANSFRARRFKYSLKEITPSRASLIICPSNIYKQWLAEAKKCNPKMTTIGFSTIHDHHRVTWKDLIEADIIVVSYQFLANSSYAEISGSKASEQPNNYYNIKGRVDLHQLHYHRLILDEFHELEAAKSKVQSSVMKFKADFVWGLTGTPKMRELLTQMAYLHPSERLILICNSNSNALAELKHKYVKRNVPNLELPPIINETVWIDLTSRELALMAMKKSSGNSTRDEIMKCCHYQLDEKETVSKESFISIDKVQKRMADSKSKLVQDLKYQVVSQQAWMEKALEKDPEADVTNILRNLKRLQNELQLAESNFNYFQSVFQVIGQPDKNECRICYDEIAESELSILPCSHVYCYGCVKTVVEKNKSCPSCFSTTKIDEIYRIKIKEPEVLPESLVKLDTSKYSSKLIGLYRYMTDLIENSEDARIILFLQYSDLADFMAESFKELGINCVRVVGNVFQRQNAIAKFRDSKDIRLIMLSSEDSVSGINLTQATHVIMLHPFWTGQGEQTDLAYEKQGIARAYRFGLEHPLKIVRFAVRGTVEEGITLRRQNISMKN